MGDRRDLPEFEDPPLTEVVLAVRFQPIPELNGPYLGILWDRAFSDRFGKVQERPPYEAPEESYDKGEHGVTFTFSDELPSPRYWFIGKDESELLQIQPNWFARNWRKAGQEGHYPRYESIRERFERDFGVFVSFCAEQSLGEVDPDQCEVTYINHIRPSSGWAHHGQLGRVLSIIGETGGDFLPEAEDIRLTCRWHMTGTPGDPPIGRLHASAEPGFERKSGEPIMRLSLTARGAPGGKAVEDALQFFDTGREWIVRAFAELTTQSMHAAWGRNL